jgi:hypothetical protein
MIGLHLSVNLGNLPAGAEPLNPQFTADWGNINTIDNLSPTVFWASTTGAQTNIANATPITFSELGKNITVTLSISGTGITAVRHQKNGGGISTSPTVSMTDGDVLKVGVLGPGVSPITASGNLIVTNTTDGYVIDTIPYTVLIED